MGSDFYHWECTRIRSISFPEWKKTALSVAYSPWAKTVPGPPVLVEAVTVTGNRG